jgi:HD-GYP domain-containing protein (c-di-GMP phosphodiesterase class II)
VRPFFCLRMYPVRCGLLGCLAYPPAVTSRLPPVPPSVRWLFVPVVAVAALILVLVSAPPPAELDLGRIFFWIVVTLVAAALPVRLPGGVHATITTAPVLAALFDPGLLNPFGVCWVAFIGTFELRDFRGGPKWYGTLFNRSDWVLSAFAGWAVLSLTQSAVRPGDPLGVLAQIAAAGGAFAVVNNGLSMLANSLNTGTALSRVWALSLSNVAIGLVSQVPLGWLMAEVADKVGLWASMLFMVPLLLARYSFSRYTETRDLFYGTVSALSQAIDAKDGFTRGHADRVSRIAGAIARELGIAEREIEQIELAGLLHDIGKIGVEDRILMKPARLDPDEQELMRRHPIYGASILEPSAALRPLVPLVLAHHENFDGTGYPQGLRGEEIPIGSRILIVADTYEAMTSDRIYRKAPGHDRAMEQLNRYKGTQFDPVIVRALQTCIERRGPDSFEANDLPPINYETLAQLRQRRGGGRLGRDERAS